MNALKKQQQRLPDPPWKNRFC